jgi:hypothetical protein
MIYSVLIGCEESQTLTAKFRAAGFEAFSADLIDTRGNPDWHIKGDVVEAIKSRHWDCIILHPPCTAICLSGNAHYGMGMRYADKRAASIEWTVALWELACSVCDLVALENPQSVIFQYLDAAVCWVQPYEHGEGEKKNTGFALYGLPAIKVTNYVEGRAETCHKMPPGPNRARDRSKTFDGIADALVSQWSGYIGKHREMTQTRLI